MCIFRAIKPFGCSRRLAVSVSPFFSLQVSRTNTLFAGGRLLLLLLFGICAVVVVVVIVVRRTNECIAQNAPFAFCTECRDDIDDDDGRCDDVDSSSSDDIGQQSPRRLCPLLAIIIVVELKRIK